jgi:predicted DCC family thiol-disulfide oxidoreductase YuxK
VTSGSRELQPVVLYDDDCAFCRWSLDKILAWDRRRQLRPVAIQSDEGQRLLEHLPETERLDSWHLVLPSGEVRSAGAAAAPLAELLPAGRPLAFLFRSFPGLTERAYRWVAANRNRFTRWLGMPRKIRGENPGYPRKKG